MPLPLDVLEGPKLKVAWAEQKIIEFNDVARLFFDRKPYRTTREFDAQADEVSVKARLSEPMPADLLRLTIECIQHLASSLDHIVYTLAFRNGVVLDVGFPFAKNGPTHLDTLLKNPNIMAIGPQAIAIIRAAQPYQGGNDMLWALHGLNNIDKHRHMVPIATGHAGYGIEFLQIQRVEAGQRVEIGRAIPDQSLETGVEILRYSVGVNPEPDPQYHILTRIVFGNVLAEVDGKEITEVLLRQRNEVASIVTAIEASCS